jgi:hypothetical protein
MSLNRNNQPEWLDTLFSRLFTWILVRPKGIRYVMITFVRVRAKMCRNQGNGGHSLRKSGDEGLEGCKGPVVVWILFWEIRMKWGRRKKCCDVGCCGEVVLIRRVFRCVRSWDDYSVGTSMHEEWFEGSERIVYKERLFCVGGFSFSSLFTRSLV